MVSIDIILMPGGELPIYQQIVDQIKGAILRKELGPDNQLPSIRVLAKELKISVITTKRAYEELEKKGLIYTVPGKGSFIANQSADGLEEAKQQAVVEKLREVLEFAKLVGVSDGELQALFTELLGGIK